MTGELFLASLCFSLACSVAAYLFAAARFRSLKGPGELDTTAIETRVADLITEMNHVANTHAHAIEDRRDSLKRVIEMANDRLRKINQSLSDLEILEKRLRGHARDLDDSRDTLVDDAGVATADAGAQRDADPGGYPSLTREVRAPRRGRATPTTGAAADRQSLHEHIKSRAAAGEDPAIIASSLRVPRNEVDLVIRGMERQ